MKHIVTGGAGFIGSNLVDCLVSNGHEVHIIDNFSTGKKENCNPKAVYHNLDISDSSKLKEFEKIMEHTHSIFHTAAIAIVQPSIKDPIVYEANNTIGTVNMLKSAVDAGVKRFVYSASSSVYGDNPSLPLKETENPNPLSPYAAQKYYGEVLCKTFANIYNIKTVSLRYFNVYGEKQNMNGAYALVIGIFLEQNKNRQPLTIRGDGNQKRDFTYVGDVVEANILASKSKKVGNGEVINIGNGDNQSINRIADLIGGEKIYINPIIEPRESLADNRLAKELLGWEPTTNVEDWIVKFKRSFT